MRQAAPQQSRRTSTPNLPLRAARHWHWLTLAIVACGCNLPAGRIVPSPLTYQAQQKEILEIAPLDTPREEAIAKLQEAGIEGEFGIRNSIYYCDVWNREDGERWHMNVALLFDDSGKLYGTHPAQATTGMASTPAGGKTPGGTRAISSTDKTSR